MCPQWSALPLSGGLPLYRYVPVGLVRATVQWHSKDHLLVMLITLRDSSVVDEMPLLSPHSRTCSPGVQKRRGNSTGYMRERSTTSDPRGNLNEARPDDRHRHFSGQSGKATRKRADVELKPPVGESAAESAGCPLLAHRVIAQFPRCRSLNRLGGCLGWKTQHSVGRESVAGRQASMTELFPAADGTWAVRPPSTPLAEQRNQKNKIVRKNLSPFLPVGHGGPIPKRG